EPFTMIMNYCNGESADDIYFFNEEEDDWVKQDGEFDYDTFTISIEATLNGKYGIFALGYDLTEETEESKTNDEVIVIDKDKDEEDKDENKVYVVANDEEDEDRKSVV